VLIVYLSPRLEGPASVEDTRLFSASAVRASSARLAEGLRVAALLRSAERLLEAVPGKSRGRDRGEHRDADPDDSSDCLYDSLDHDDSPSVARPVKCATPFGA